MTQEQGSSERAQLSDEQKAVVLEYAKEAFGRSLDFSNCFGEPSERSVIAFAEWVRSTLAADRATAPVSVARESYVQFCDELTPRTAEEKSAYLEGIEEGKMRARRDAAPVSVAEPVAILWPVPLEMNQGHVLEHAVELRFESEEDSAEFVRLYGEQMGERVATHDTATRAQAPDSAAAQGLRDGANHIVEPTEKVAEVVPIADRDAVIDECAMVCERIVLEEGHSAVGHGAYLCRRYIRALKERI
jgi:hypothetical protein